jgi:hypothetical protein
MKKFETIVNIEKQLNDKDCAIDTLIRKVNVIENKLVDKDNIIKELSDKVKSLMDNVATKEIEELENNDTEDNNTSETIEEETFKCTECGFISKSSHGLNIHKKRKHEEKLRYEICYAEFDNKRILKIHTKTHSYNKNMRKYVCEKCECACSTVEDLEVHLGKCCNEYIECGLCEVRFENLKVLEIHQTTCEIYECADCFEKYQSLSDIKNHMKEEHDNSEGFNHMKMDREDKTKVNFKAYLQSEV